MNDNWKCDVRVGCIAVYEGEKQNCLADAEMYAKHFWRGKHDPVNGWTVKRIDVFVAKTLTFLYNFFGYKDKL
jgi:hypothetical protein